MSEKDPKEWLDIRALKAPAGQVVCEWVHVMEALDMQKDLDTAEWSKQLQASDLYHEGRIQELEMQIAEASKTITFWEARTSEYKAENKRLREGWLRAECEGWELAQETKPTDCDMCKHTRKGRDYCAHVLKIIEGE